MPEFKPIINSRRRIVNYFVEPVLQIKLPMSLLVLTFIFMVMSVLLIQLYFGAVYNSILGLTGYPELLGEHIKRMVISDISETRYLFFVVFFVYISLFIIIAIAYTHKLVGSSVTLKRHICALKEGNFSSRVSLRKNDAFAEIADELNELASSLETKSKESKNIA